MTRRRFIYPDYGAKKLHVTPEFNGDRTEVELRKGCLDSCDVTAEELFTLFKVSSLEDFHRANAQAQAKFHSFLDVPGQPKEIEPVIEMGIDELPQLQADELVFILGEDWMVSAPSDWDGRLESLYEKVQTVFHSTVALAQSLNSLVTGQGAGFLDYCEGIVISDSELAVINEYLEADTEGAYQGEDNTIVKTVRFPDGKIMDIKCCGSENEASWTEAVLFDPHGSELACSEVCDQFEGTWELKHNGILYTAIVKRESHCV